MGFESMITPIQGKNEERTSDIQALVENYLGENSSEWYIRYSQGEWVAVWKKGFKSAGEEQILLLPGDNTLLTEEALRYIWYFVDASKANISFDPKIAVLYRQVTIIGNANLDNGIDMEWQQRLSENPEREVERINCQTGEELVSILRERLDRGIYFEG